MYAYMYIEVSEGMGAWNICEYIYIYIYIYMHIHYIFINIFKVYLCMFTY